jgi:hypothetical protein
MCFGEHVSRKKEKSITHFFTGRQKAGACEKPVKDDWFTKRGLK